MNKNLVKSVMLLLKLSICTLPTVDARNSKTLLNTTIVHAVDETSVFTAYLMFPKTFHGTAQCGPIRFTLISNFQQDFLTKYHIETESQMV